MASQSLPFPSVGSAYGNSIQLEYTDYQSLPEKDQDNLIMSGYSANTSLVSNSQPEIVLTLQQLELPMEIITHAIDIYYVIQQNKTKQKRNNEQIPTPRAVKGSRKIRLMFYCVFMAYREVGYPVDPCYAAEKVGLGNNEIDHALAEYSISGVTLLRPEELITFYLDRINEALEEKGIRFDPQVFGKGIREVLDSCRSTPAGKQWLENRAAKNVAIAALYFYLNDIKNTEVSKYITTIEKVCYLTRACIRRYYEEVAKYYNNDIEDDQTGYSEWW